MKTLFKELKNQIKENVMNDVRTMIEDLKQPTCISVGTNEYEDFKKGLHVAMRKNRG